MFGKVLLLSLSALVLWGIVARASSGARPERVYVVQPHDTLWSIAAKSSPGVDPRDAIWQLERRNHLAGATIVPGEKLVVPG
jgi:LysM repeat protein